MNSFSRNTNSKLYNAVSAPVAATRDALKERLQSVRDTVSLLYNRMMENMRYGQDRLKGIVKKEAEEQQQEPAATKEEEAKEQHKDRQQPRNNNRIIMSNMIVTNKKKKSWSTKENARRNSG